MKQYQTNVKQKSNKYFDYEVWKNVMITPAGTGKLKVNAST